MVFGVIKSEHTSSSLTTLNSLNRPNLRQANTLYKDNSVDLSVSTILQPWVRFQSTTSTLFWFIKFNRIFDHIWCQDWPILSKYTLHVLVLVLVHDSKDSWIPITYCNLLYYLVHYVPFNMQWMDNKLYFVPEAVSSYYCYIWLTKLVVFFP